MDQVLLWLQTNLYGIVGGSILVITVFGVALAFLKRAVSTPTSTTWR